ncbi:hypothetical protein NDU88_005840, partial [Pleurodeles waltl]
MHKMATSHMVKQQQQAGGMGNKEHMQAYGKGILAGCTKWPSVTWSNNNSEQRGRGTKNT